MHARDFLQCYLYSYIWEQPVILINLRNGRRWLVEYNETHERDNFIFNKIRLFNTIRSVKVDETFKTLALNNPKISSITMLRFQDIVNELYITMYPSGNSDNIVITRSVAPIDDQVVIVWNSATSENSNHVISQENLREFLALNRSSDDESNYEPKEYLKEIHPSLACGDSAFDKLYALIVIFFTIYTSER